MDEFIITSVLSIYQQARTTGKEGYPSTANFQNVNACITPVKPELQLAYGAGMSYQMFNVIIYDTTLSLGNDDKLVDQNGTIYFIEGMPISIDTPLLSFTKVLAKQKV